MTERAEEHRKRKAAALRKHVTEARRGGAAEPIVEASDPGRYWAVDRDGTTPTVNGNLLWKDERTTDPATGRTEYRTHKRSTGNPPGRQAGWHKEPSAEQRAYIRDDLRDTWRRLKLNDRKVTRRVTASESGYPERTLFEYIPAGEPWKNYKKSGTVPE